MSFEKRKLLIRSCLFAGSLALLSSSADAGSSSSLMDISPDGKVLACSNRDSGTLTFVDLAEHKKLSEIPVGVHPEGVAFVGDGLVAVAIYNEDKVVFVDSKSGKITHAVDVFDEPYGVVGNSDGSKIYVTLDYPGQVVEIDVAAKNVSRSFDAGKFVRGLAISPDDRRLYITEYYTGVVRSIDVKSGEIADEWAGASTDNLARQIVLHPTRPKAYLPHIRSRVTVARGQGSIFPYVAVVDTAAANDEDRRRKRIPMDAFQANRVMSNPWEIAVSPDGKQLYVVFSGTNDMFACNILDDNYREIALRSAVSLGNNPRAAKVSPDNSTLYVYNALDFNVVAMDTKSLGTKATIAVTENPLGDDVLLGKRLFYSALQPMVGRRWISCSSCHPDGDSDGRTWHNPEGLRNTQALFGMAWTHPIHWSADRDEVQDFEHTIRGLLMQGRGLIRGPVNEQLGEPNKGLSKELDALAAYANTHKFTLSPHAKSGLNESAKRGRELFFSEQTKCATCHSGPLFTDSQPRKVILRHDVGTGTDDPGEKMGPAYDTPTLLGVYRTAPYLHHGKAETLHEMLTTLNPDDKHGSTSQLSKSQVDDLVEFLKALPYEDPIPLAEKAGYQKVE